MILKKWLHLQNRDGLNSP